MPKIIITSICLIAYSGYGFAAEDKQVLRSQVVLKKTFLPLSDPPLRSPERRPQAPHPKSKFLL